MTRILPPLLLLLLLQVCLLWASSQGPWGQCCECAMHDLQRNKHTT
jgi:hypothetical protein